MSIRLLYQITETKHSGTILQIMQRIQVVHCMVYYQMLLLCITGEELELHWCKQDEELEWYWFKSNEEMELFLMHTKEGPGVFLCNLNQKKRPAASEAIWTKISIKYSQFIVHIQHSILVIRRLALEEGGLPSSGSCDSDTENDTLNTRFCFHQVFCRTNVGSKAPKSKLQSSIRIFSQGPFVC